MLLRRSDHLAALRLSSGRIFILFAPVLVLGALAALLALLAGLAGWNPHITMPVAGGIGIAATLLALWLAYRLRARGLASDRALHNIEARVGGILDSAMDGIITTDERQRIVQYNGAAGKLFGWPRRAVIGKPLDVLLPHRSGQATAKTSTSSERPGSRRDAWAARRWWWDCARTETNSPSRPRSRRSRRKARSF